MKKLAVILMALLLVLTMVACVDNGQGEESHSDTKKPAENTSDVTDGDDVIDENNESNPVDNESNNETEAAVPSESETTPETTNNNSGVIELPRDTF